MVKESIKTVDDFVKDSETKNFFLETIDNMLAEYEPGKIENKQDVLKQMEVMAKQRNEMMEMHKLKQQISMNGNYEKIIKEQQEKINYLEKKISELIQDKITYLKEKEAKKEQLD
jgi:hypothetical protein